MKDMLSLIPVVLYFIIGIICTIMSLKCLLADRLLPFQEMAAGRQWNEIDDHLQIVMLSMLKLSGLGFLVVAILLLVFPIYGYFMHTIFLSYAAPLIACMFCLGLFAINYSLYKKTKAASPWKNSLLAIIVLSVGIIISLLTG